MEKIMLRDLILHQISEIEKSLYGMTPVIKIYCLSKACDLTVMLLGPHATAKSSLARLWSLTTGLEYRVVTSSEVDESLIAYIDPSVFREKNIVQMRRGELMEKDHIIVDEFFLWLNKYRAKLHQLLEEHTYAGLDVLTKTYTFLSNPLSEFYAGQIEEKNLACYSMDTEILTTHGWKKYSELSEKEEIFTFNPKTGYIEKENIFKKVDYEYQGKMYSFESQQINWLVTPNHRMWVQRGRNGSFGFVQAIDLYGKEFSANKTASWNGKSFNKDYMRILGYYLAEGSPKTDEKTGHYGICLTLVIPKYIDKAVTSLRKLGYNPSVDKYGNVVVWNKQLWAEFKPLGKSFEKYIPAKYKDADQESLRALIEAYFEGDGWNQNGQWLAKTVSPRLRDDLQEISLKAHWALNFSFDVEPHSSWSPKLQRNITGRHQCYILHLIKKRTTPFTWSILNKNRSPRVKEEWKDYSGKVWCVATRNGILYVRRKGISSWSGNTIDRIDLFVPVNQPKIVPSESMMRKFSKFGRKEKPLVEVISWDDYTAAHDEISKIYIPSRIIIWLTLFAHSMSSCKQLPDKFSVSIAKLKKTCASCNENAHLCGKVCLSKPRFLRATVILAKGLAWLSGRTTVSFEDINEAILYTLPHRLSWIQEDLSYAESLEAVPELIQLFNDEMLAWKNRGIFSDLSKVIDGGKQHPPIYEEKIGNSLLADVSEIHLLKEFVSETLETVQADISKDYLTESEKKNFDTLTELKLFLEQSKLGPFEREDLLYQIASSKKKLSYTISSTPENVERLISNLIAFHKKEKVTIEDKTILERKIAEKIMFDSELLKVREQRGEIQIVFETPLLRNSFKKLMGI